MNTEFDKDIDRLLRDAARRNVEPRAGDAAGAHLDADALSLYVEDALPPAARATCTEHLADCGACRARVALLARMSAAEAAPHAVAETVAPPAVAAPIEEEHISIWEKFRLGFFSTRGLAYALPLLLLCAVGLTIFLRTSRQSRDAEPLVAGVRESSADAPYGMTANLNSANMNSSIDDAAAGLAQSSNMNANMGTTAGTAAPAQERAASVAPRSGAEGATTSQSEAPPQTPGRADAGGQKLGGEIVSSTVLEQLAVNGRQANVPTQLAPSLLPPPPPKPVAANNNSSNFVLAPAARPAEAKATAAERETRKQEDDEIILADEARAAADTAPQPTPVPSAPATLATPNTVMLRGRAVRREDNRVAAKAPAVTDTAKRTVGDRRFTRRGAVWVDEAYTEGVRVTEVRRGSEQYRALLADEPGLRRTIEALDGEVIVVWKQRAYRFR